MTKTTTGRSRIYYDADRPAGYQTIRLDRPDTYSPFACRDARGFLPDVDFNLEYSWGEIEGGIRVEVTAYLNPKEDYSRMDKVLAVLPGGKEYEFEDSYAGTFRALLNETTDEDKWDGTPVFGDDEEITNTFWIKIHVDY